MSEAFQRWLRWLEERLRPPAEELNIIDQASRIEGPVRVVADSSCDLSLDLAERHHVKLVPLIVRFGQEEYPETTLSREEFWHLAQEIAPPQTSQPPIGAFEEVFEPLVEQGAAVLCLTITSKHSGTYNAAWAAAQRFPGRVWVWDSLNISIGMGFQVLEAAALSQQGHPLWEIVREISWIRRNCRLTFLLETIEYIRRGGRLQRAIDALERLVSVLNIRPLLRMTDGELRILGAVRSQRRGLARLRAEAEEEFPLYRLGVAHTCRPEDAALLASELAQQSGLPAETVQVIEVGAALSSHAGPGALGVLTIKQGNPA